MRDGLAHKRVAILDAARTLFVRHGVRGTSMDAISVAAGVSKRTVYDYYGDKRGLLLGVVERAGESLLQTARAAIDDNLSDSANIQNVQELARALTSFATQYGSRSLESGDYAAAVRLISESQEMLPELKDHPLQAAREELLAERMEHFAKLGLLSAPKPRLAAAHFTALTTLLGYDERTFLDPDPQRIRQIMIDGVDAFMRAYVKR